MSFSFQALDQSLARHLARAVTSRLHPQSDALRTHLSHVLSAPANTAGSLLSDPVFEATFDYERVAHTLADLVGDLLSPTLIDALDAPGPRRFARHLRPFTHQVAAWRALLSDTPQSALISSGTGSGKTECFLIPILEDLVRLSAAVGPLVGVRALFLYPLNALIESQRGRLDAWTAPLGGRVRFSLYNGLTPEEVKNHDFSKSRSQVPDRKRLRESPPPILVTNATMLEYMLVRTQDRAILEASKGKLRWIVLDEAHTYIGSQAAELALLIRRVMQAFAVEPTDVRLVATSATIGSAQGEGLRQFLADVGGLPLESVVFVRGQRGFAPLAVPPTNPGLPDAATRAVITSSAPDTRFELLARYETIQNLRADLAEGPKTLTELAERHDEAPDDIASCLDLAHTALHDGQPLLPLRGHRFIRTLPGIWACLNPACTGRQGTALDHPSWTHGKLYFENRDTCEACDALVAELVFCRTCGTDWLAFGLEDGQGVPALVPYRFTPPDVGELASDKSSAGDNDDDAAPSTSRAQRVRLVGPASGAPVRLSPDGRWEDPDGFPLGVAPIAPDGRITCGHCGEAADSVTDLTVRGYASRPFLLGVALPLALGHMPPDPIDPFSPKPEYKLPLEGRRLLTFTDSRQGSARFAMLLKQEGERRFVQSVVYHQLWAESSMHELPEQEAKVAQLENAVGMVPTLLPMLAAERTKLEAMRRSGPSMVWDKLVDRLADTSELQWIRKVNFPLHPKFDNPKALAHFLLQREFLRRPRRNVTLETLGLAALRDPNLALRSAPTTFRSLGGVDAEWQDFLGLALEQVRARNAVAVDEDLAQWLGEEFHRSFLVSAEVADVLKPSVRFYSRSEGYPPRGRLVNVLMHRFQLDPTSQRDATKIRAVLEETWEALASRGALTHEPDGRRLDWSRLEVFIPLSVVRCPITLRALPFAPGDVSPYATPSVPSELARGVRYDMPRFAHAFSTRTNPTQGRLATTTWLNEDPTIATLRAVGLWVEFSDRIAEFADYFRAHEHSAQIPPGLLRDLEKQFSEGHVNILSCSTTMEMGIDIGGLSVVAMNNAPPGPANFLQRAGRAGRRGETTSLSLTMCRPSPHDEAIWHNPTWPFRTPIAIPRVALESRRIVQRHLNAFFLGRFLAEHPDTNATTLQCGHFFGATQQTHASGAVGMAPPYEQFKRWLASTDRPTTLAEPLARLTLGSPLATHSASDLLATSSSELMRIAEDWLSEHSLLTAELGAFTTGTVDESKAIKALELNLKRLEGEFLLKELSQKAWLPVHGFPTDVVPFIPLHLADILRLKDDSSRGQGRNDDLRSAGTFPTRNLPIALSEYAPGSGVVIDGKVHISRGVTLNWKYQPQPDDTGTEIQALRQAARCRTCGAIADHTYRIELCETCGSEDLERAPYLLPAGFAVDLMEAAHNDLSKAVASPSADPWVACEGAPWTDATPYLRYRQSHDGKIFYHHRGDGSGFGICLRCGAAAPMQGDSCPGLKNHRPLRGYKSQKSKSGYCLGNEETHAIQHKRYLGKLATSDLFELQLRFPESLAVPSQTALVSLAVALQSALSRQLGIDRRELGFAITRHDWDGVSAGAIAIFDTAPGGAGYSPRAADDGVRGIEALIRDAEEVLACHEHQCDRACHGCLLSFDTDRLAHHLDRHEGGLLASAVLTSTSPDRKPKHHHPGIASELGHDPAVDVSTGRGFDLESDLPPEDEAEN